VCGEKTAKAGSGVKKKSMVVGTEKGGGNEDK